MLRLQIMKIKKITNIALKISLYFTNAGTWFEQNKQTMIATGVQTLSIYGSELSLVRNKKKGTRTSFCRLTHGSTPRGRLSPPEQKIWKILWLRENRWAFRIRKTAEITPSLVLACNLALWDRKKSEPKDSFYLQSAASIQPRTSPPEVDLPAFRPSG